MPVGSGPAVGAAEAIAHRAPRTCIGVSLKMYFGYRQTLDWCQRVAELSRRHPAVLSGAVELFVLPSFPALAPALAELAHGGVRIGAQDLFWEASGDFTGEVSGPFLAEMGCRYVEVGHAERRRLFGETDAIVAAKVQAALQAGLCPVICIGETERTSAQEAVETCVEELNRALSSVRHSGRSGSSRRRVRAAVGDRCGTGSLVDHIRTVCMVLARHLDTIGADKGSRVIYGGSAGPGLLTALDGAVSGLFLGRFAHDPAALEAVLDEAVRNAVPGG